KAMTRVRSDRPVAASDRPAREAGRATASDLLAVARQALLAEADAIRGAADRLGDGLLAAADLIVSREGKVIVTALGKSGHIANKIAATLCSTGTTAVFLHAGEAVHGDLGVYRPGDATILISKSGTTAELVQLLPTLRQFQSPLIGIIGNMNSPLAREVDVCLDATVPREADPLDLAPTASTAVALALGDALAAVLMHIRGFREQDFARLHPAGQLGRNLWLKVSDVMHRGDEVAWLNEKSPLREVVIAMTQRPLGAACVVRPDHTLLGIITDGDLRRTLQTHDDIRALIAADVMTRRPIVIDPHLTLLDAVRRMEERQSQLSVLPVVDENGVCDGLLRIHDIYQAARR
ncbi:MAG TPA: KpsF/GutQ family sugar-phosphate isomerase, partial [Stellaceae bacterium]|nr:KpsF/GutQ family sugar-phosphate isomerase [Stellaceae bacterium]